MVRELLYKTEASKTLFAMRNQQTIKSTISSSGKGLHSGAQVSIKLIPASPGSGVRFIQNTPRGRVEIKVSSNKVVATDLSTTLGESGSSVQTVEHLLSALSGLQISNLIVELDSKELPIMDGSAKPFVDLIQKAGILRQKAVQPCIRINRPLEVKDGGKRISIRPADSFSVDCTIRYEHPLISEQRLFYNGEPEEFIRQIAPARTFGFLREVEALWRRGLARGGSTENAIVLGPESVLNKEGLRFPDEFVRHKVLDLIGDLSLIGMPLVGQVEAFCPGHQMNARLVEKIIASPSHWEVVEEEAPLHKGSPKETPLSITV